MKTYKLVALVMVIILGLCSSMSAMSIEEKERKRILNEEKERDNAYKEEKKQAEEYVNKVTTSKVLDEVSQEAWDNLSDKERYDTNLLISTYENQIKTQGDSYGVTRKAINKIASNIQREYEAKKANKRQTEERLREYRGGLSEEEYKNKQDKLAKEEKEQQQELYNKLDPNQYTYYKDYLNDLAKFGSKLKTKPELDKYDSMYKEAVRVLAYQLISLHAPGHELIKWNLMGAMFGNHFLVITTRYNNKTHILKFSGPPEVVSLTTDNWSLINVQSFDSGN